MTSFEGYNVTMKFLHIADIHLGCTRYQLSESPRDFFEAWVDVLERYAIEESVEFVLISGDFFHKRTVPPETMDHAVEGLTLLKEAGIPVVAIEGNHDQKHTDSEYSWLRSLSNWGLLTLLEPTHTASGISYSAWTEDSRKGGFVDLGRARIFGSHWYGAAANWAIPMLTKALSENLRENAFHILLLHTDVEGHQTHPLPALRIDSLRELKRVTQYVALGHTHRSYEVDNWAFNPGSLEITSIDDYRELRGAFLVNVDENGNLDARHLRDYKQRPFQRLTFDVSGLTTAEDVQSELIETVKTEARVADGTAPLPIIEITLRGLLGFPNSLLDLRGIREECRQMTGALHVRLRNHTSPTEIGSTDFGEEDPSREKLERRVVEDLVARDSRFTSRQSSLADAVIGSKRMALSEDEPEKIADFIAMKIKE
jgi:DNA repair exonuclease SbcCD nuclease subunit